MTLHVNSWTGTPGSGPVQCRSSDRQRKFEEAFRSTNASEEVWEDEVPDASPATKPAQACKEAVTA